MNDSVHAIPLPTPKVLAKKGDGIGWITFNQPEKRNAISMSMWDAVAAAAEMLGRDDSVRVVVLSGAGGKAFASGADISEFAAARASAEDEEKYHAHADDARTALRTMGKPIIAMIQGFCIGGGCATALLADLRVATPESKFGVPAAKLGVAYALEGLHRLVALVGPSVAKEIMFTGRQFTAAEAFAAGLINRIVEPADLERIVSGLAQTIARNAPLSIFHSRETIDMLAGDPSKWDRARIEALYAKCFDSEDFREGRTAFMEKRTPTFRGR
jgi:enoyl-CoA hydratase/carnithine racemase